MFGGFFPPAFSKEKGPKNPQKNHPQNWPGTFGKLCLGFLQTPCLDINFLGPETARWGGGLPREGVGVEKFVLSLGSLFSLGFEGGNLGCPRNFAGTSQTCGGVQKICAKRVCANFSADFPREFFSLVSLGGAWGPPKHFTPKTLHPQNSRPKLSAFLSTSDVWTKHFFTRRLSV